MSNSSNPLRLLKGVLELPFPFPFPFPPHSQFSKSMPFNTDHFFSDVNLLQLKVPASEDTKVRALDALSSISTTQANVINNLVKVALKQLTRFLQ
ncbi:hypothetical protein P9112_002304 [Eukaryota sp. TZLM1-RC]